MMAGVRALRFAPAALLVAAVLLACAAAQAQSSYRWTDAKGNVHYTDSPPPTSAKDARTIGPPDPAAPRDLTKIPRVEPPKPTGVQPSPAVAPAPEPAIGDVQKQLEQNREYLRKQQNPKTQAERAKRDAEQCAAWRKSLARVEAAQKQTGPKQPNATEMKDLAQTKAELDRNIAALCTRP